ncbi:branched-chain amino acid ABC transporter permease [Caenimonas sp. SL110]|uniref:branched-chain amino acid ABC transporter permease n=1 Tax=Caenimonas sp. SL110 TaxID=1450524 RepID=UPI0006549CD1|nr:branched-chain amino acid ABC transporter permease [Caenimonas sp. SL110]
MTGFYIFTEFTLLGLLAAGVSALMALSFVLVYKGTHVVNFAAGEVMMLGAYLYYTAAVLLKLPPALALVVALAGIALASVAIEALVLRPLAGQPTIAILMATIGMASLLHGGVEIIWGQDPLETPALLPRFPVNWGEVMIPGAAIGNFVVASVLIAGLVIFFRYSRAGIAMRATASDPVTAATLGVDIRASQRMTWILSGVTGTVAGALIASSGSVSPALASSALGVFAVVILGGLDSVAGAIIASLVVGVLESLTVGYIGGKMRDVFPYLVVLAMLIVRPYGLLGTREIERL